MSTVLVPLVGQKVQKAEKLYDYLQLRFDNGVLINIFNIFTVIGCDSGDVSQLVGCKVNSVKENDLEIEFAFTDGKSLRIGMRDDDYQGPEAMEYIGVDGGRVVW